MSRRDYHRSYYWANLERRREQAREAAERRRRGRGAKPRPPTPSPIEIKVRRACRELGIRYEPLVHDSCVASISQQVSSAQNLQNRMAPKCPRF